MSRVRFGYRRLTVMLRREGWPVNALAFVLITLCGAEAVAQQAAAPLSADEASTIASDAYATVIR